MNYQWDKRQERIVKEVSDQEQVLTSQSKQAIEIFLQLFVSEMRKYVPGVIPNMGKFYISPWKTERFLRNLFAAHRNGTITRDELREKVTAFWPIHEMARKHHPRTGIGYRAKLRADELRRQNSDSGEL